MHDLNDLQYIIPGISTIMLNLELQLCLKLLQLQVGPGIYFMQELTRPATSFVPKS